MYSKIQLTSNSANVDSLTLRRQVFTIPGGCLLHCRTYCSLNTWIM